MAATVEESKQNADGDINHTFEIVASHQLFNTYMTELMTAFTKNRTQEALLKAPKADGAEQDKKKKKQAPTSL